MVRPTCFMGIAARLVIMSSMKEAWMVNSMIRIMVITVLTALTDNCDLGS